MDKRTFNVLLLGVTRKFNRPGLESENSGQGKGGASPRFSYKKERNLEMGTSYSQFPRQKPPGKIGSKKTDNNSVGKYRNIGKKLGSNVSGKSNKFWK